MPTLSPALTAYLYTLTAVLGLVMGSFLNCFAYRYAKGESVLKGRSCCALCGHTLSAPDLIPVFSWLLLRGKCRYCGGKFSPRYLLAEVLCALAYVSVLWRFGLTLDTLKYLVLASLLFAASFADLHGGLIPDRLILIGLAFALVFACISPEGPVWLSLLKTLGNGLSVSLPLLVIVLVFDRVMKTDSMGGGDIKLLFLIGLYFHWALNLLILILACVVGLAWAMLLRRGRKDAFAFAPAVSAAAWLVMLWGQAALNWYLSLF